MYQRQIAYAYKGDFYIYPNAKEGQTKINLELSTPLGKEVEINVYNDSNTKYIINFNNNKYFQIKYKKVENAPNYIKLTAIEDKTLLSVKITDESLYKIVENNSRRINEERILFKLVNKQNYKNENITLKRVSHDYIYTMFRGDMQLIHFYLDKKLYL